MTDEVRLLRAAQNVSDRRTLADNGGFWVSRKEMRALDIALGPPYSTEELALSPDPIPAPEVEPHDVRGHFPYHEYPHPTDHSHHPIPAPEVEVFLDTNFLAWLLAFGTDPETGNGSRYGSMNAREYADVMLASYRESPEAYPAIRTAASSPAPELETTEAVEKALLYVFQLSGKDYRKMQTALSEHAFIRALEQDGYTVAAIRTAAPSLDVERECLTCAVDAHAGWFLYETSREGSKATTHAKEWTDCANKTCVRRRELVASHDR